MINPFAVLDILGDDKKKKPVQKPVNKKYNPKNPWSGMQKKADEEAKKKEGPEYKTEDFLK